jgi:PAS domain-containing protein
MKRNAPPPGQPRGGDETPRSCSEPEREQLGNRGIRHVVLLPVRGKKTVIGCCRSAAPEPAPHPGRIGISGNGGAALGIAVENLRLLEQVLRSQRQWMNTFDSIQDLILAHDADFRILKTNQAFCNGWKRRPPMCLGNRCEEVLPQRACLERMCPIANAVRG